MPSEEKAVYLGALPTSPVTLNLAVTLAAVGQKYGESSRGDTLGLMHCRESEVGTAVQQQ